MTTAAEVPVFILCGGLGTRFREQTEFRPKPMIPIGNKPILWHIMRTYAKHGFRRFVLCLGYKAEIIKSYFLDYSSLNSDFTVDLSTDNVTVHSVDHQDNWEVTLAYTGELMMTGGRIALATSRYLGDSEHFAVTYGDGVTDANLAQLLAFHLAHDRLGTVLGTTPPSRYGEIKYQGSEVIEFSEKPEFKDQWINGGYFFFRRGFLGYLSQEETCVLEQAPLVKLAQDEQLSIFKHEGFWHCMDTQRDLDRLSAMWDSGQAPWKV